MWCGSARLQECSAVGCVLHFFLSTCRTLYYMAINSSVNTKSTRWCFSSIASNKHERYAYELLLSLKWYLRCCCLKYQVPCLSDSSEVWSDKLSDQRIMREPKGLSCICLVYCKSDHDVRSTMCMVWHMYNNDMTCV